MSGDAERAERIFGRPEVSSTRPDGQTIFFPESESGERRALIYVGLAIVLVLGAIAVHRFEWTSGPELNAVLEAVSTVLAFVIGALALVRFYSRKRSTYLFLGTGLLADAVLEGFHTILIAPLGMGAVNPEFSDLAAWSWIASRLFLSLFLFVSWLAWYREREDEAERSVKPPISELSVYVTAGALTIIIFWFFSTSPLAQAYRPDALLSRPGEFAPGFFFSLALAGFLTKGDWRRDTFEHWLVIALILSVATHFGFMIFSKELYDLPFVAAHVLKILSYVAVLVGLLASVYITFRREGEASSAILEANAALAKEVKTRSKAERILQESEERLQDFLDNATDLIQSTDPTGRLLYVNTAWKRTLGYSDEDLEELDILSVVNPDSREAFRRATRRVFQGEAVADFEIVFLAKDGSSVICAGSSNCRFEGDRPVATRSIFRNVTEERRAAEELARSQANVRALFESTGDAIWSVDRRHRLITFNTAYALMAEVISGRVPSVGDELSRLTAPEAVGWYRECYDRALAGSRFSAVREERIAGQDRVFELFFNPIEGDEGIDGVVVFSKDVTRRKIAEEALRKAKLEAEEANQAKSQFMANMSHELRTPLNSVIGFANILMKKQSGQLEAKELEYLERILANGKHLLSLINEILDLSKIEAGQMEVELEEVGLPALIEQTLSQMEAQVAGRPVALRSEIVGSPEPLLADPGKLKQVIINLVGNALKFTSEGEVVIRVETDESGSVPHRVRVMDTGPGIPPDRLEAIFEAFQQADSSTSRRFGGTGLGLTISRSLCALMGYRITVSSKVGEGSVFTVHLVERRAAEGPRLTGRLDEPPVGRWAGSEAERLDLGDRTVIIVDDESDSRTLLEHSMRELGCRVLHAKDGVEGLELARRERPDLITVDLMMPRMSGWEMLRTLRRDPALRDIPTVVISVIDQETSSELPDDVDVLKKPLDREELKRVMRRNLSRGPGRVLLVEGDPDLRGKLQRYLRESGLSVRGSEDGESAVSVVRDTEVDLILLDLHLPGMDGFQALRALRDLPNGRTVPIVILATAELTKAQSDVLSQGADRVVIKNEDIELRLREALDHYFGVARRAAELS